MSTLIRYIQKYEKDAGTGILTPVYKSKRIVTKSSQRYHNSMHKTAKLSPNARNLLDYLVENMNKENEVSNTPFLKKEFRQFLRDTCAMDYSDNTINKGFQELKRANLLVSFAKLKSVYIVNPLHFFNGTEKERVSLLQKLLNAVPKCNAGTNLAEALGFAA